MDKRVKDGARGFVEKMTTASANGFPEFTPLELANYILGGGTQDLVDFEVQPVGYHVICATITYFKRYKGVADLHVVEQDVK